MQLPFGFTTGEALLYETLPSPLTPHNHPSQPFQKSDTIHPGSLLGSLLRQDRSVYQQPVSTLSVDQMFLDSRALLSVPSKPWSEDVLADSLRHDSLEKVLGDQEELKELERVLLELKDAKGDPIQLGDILANDVFSYVEEALMRETSGQADVNAHNDYAQHQDCLLPSNQMMECQTSAESDFRTIYCGHE